MTLDTQPLIEQASEHPQNIRQLYDEFVSCIGQGVNPLFLKAPQDAVFSNFIGDGEKPFLYLEHDVEGEKHIKKWLSQPDIDRIKQGQEQPRVSPETMKDILYDMFSFMIGGRKPTLEEIGVKKWIELLPAREESVSPEVLGKLKKLLNYIDHDSKTALRRDLSQNLGLSYTGAQPRRVIANNGQQAIVLLAGDICWSRDKLFVWHPIRNQPRHTEYATTNSPFKSDGNIHFSTINDIQTRYKTKDEWRITRLNTMVFLLARHGISEETNQKTAPDQVYLSLKDYVSDFFPIDAEERKRHQEEENESFVITHSLNGYAKLQERKRNSVFKQLTKMAKEGQFDEVLKEIAVLQGRGIQKS